MALSQEQIDQLLAGLDTRQLPAGQFIWTDRNGSSYNVERDKDGNISFPNGGQPIDTKPATSKQQVKTFADGTTHIVTQNADGTITAGDQIAQKAPKVMEGKVEKLGDGWHAVTYDDTGKPQVDPQVISPLPGKTLSPGQKLRNAPDGLHAVNGDGSLGALVAGKPPKEWAPGTATKNTAVAGKYDAEANKLTEGFLATYGPQIAAIHKAVSAGNMTTDEGQQAIDGLTQQAIQEAKTGMTAAQQATNQTAQRNQDMTQGNNRASNAASVYNTAQSTAMDAAKNGAGGAASAAGFMAMLHGAPGFQADMGGAPAPAASGMATMDHKQRIYQLMASGQAPADANGNRYPAAVQMAAQEAGALPADGSDRRDIGANASQAPVGDYSAATPGQPNFLSAMAGT